MMERPLSPGAIIEANQDLIRDLTNALIIARATVIELRAEIEELRKTRAGGAYPSTVNDVNEQPTIDEPEPGWS